MCSVAIKSRLWVVVLFTSGTLALARALGEYQDAKPCRKWGAGLPISYLIDAHQPLLTRLTSLNIYEELTTSS